MTLEPIRVRINQTTLELLEGDITQQDTDAIVNATNSQLVVGGGVDRAIHKAAGPELHEATKTLGSIVTGDAKITKGYHLKARHVIHAVGPIYVLDPVSAPDFLTSAYRRSLEVAVDHGLKSVAFPAISTGIYGYPLGEAALIALQTVYEFFTTSKSLETVRFVLFNDEIFNAFAAALAELMKQHTDIQKV
jgi:O-acetyl-ADP-ribose deacetylase (regulator of RNase III)